MRILAEVAYVINSQAFTPHPPSSYRAGTLEIFRLGRALLVLSLAVPIWGARYRYTALWGLSTPLYDKAIY